MLVKAPRLVSGAAGSGLAAVRTGDQPLLESGRLPRQDASGQPPRGPATLHPFPQAPLPGRQVVLSVEASQSSNVHMLVGHEQQD